MDPIVVLTDQRGRTSPAIAAAVQLAPLLAAELVLLPLAQPVPEPAGPGFAAPEGLALARLAHALPVKASVACPDEQAPADAAHLLSRYHPQLVVLDRPADAPDTEALREIVREVLRRAPFPLLVLPTAPNPKSVWPPNRLVIAADGDPFNLGEGAGVVRQLLRATRGSLTTLRVTTPNTPASHYDAVQQVMEAGLLPYPIMPEVLHWIQPRPADGIIAGARSVQPHLLVLAARRRSLWGNLFHQSVTADVMMRCLVPVLIIPTID